MKQYNLPKKELFFAVEARTVKAGDRMIIIACCCDVAISENSGVT